MELVRRLDDTVRRLQLKSKELDDLKMEHKEAEDKFVFYKVFKTSFEFFTSQFKQVRALEEELGRCKAELSTKNTVKPIGSTHEEVEQNGET